MHKKTNESNSFKEFHNFIMVLFYQKGDDHMTALMLIAFLPELWFVATHSILQAIVWGVIATLLSVFCICAEIDEKKRTSRH